jgi:hypothetical protein
MHTTTTHSLPWFTPLAAACAEAWRGFGQRLQRLSMTSDERYLRDAQDLVDLERRLKQIERGS